MKNDILNMKLLKGLEELKASWAKVFDDIEAKKEKNTEKKSCLRV